MIGSALNLKKLACDHVIKSTHPYRRRYPGPDQYAPEASRRETRHSIQYAIAPQKLKSEFIALSEFIKSMKLAKFNQIQSIELIPISPDLIQS